MGRSIFYFTSSISLGKISINRDHVEIGPGEPFSLVETGDGDSIILVYDELSLSQFINNVWVLLRGDDIEKFTFVYHSKPERAIVDFLIEKSNLYSQPVKSIHDPKFEESKFYLSLEETIEKCFLGQKISELYHSTLWKEVTCIGESSIDTQQRMSDWILSIDSGLELPDTKNRILFINSLNEEEAEKMNRLGVNVKSPFELMQMIDSEELNSEDSLIIPCELLINAQDEQVNSSELFGIKLTQSIRRKKFKGRILFVSFNDYSSFDKGSLSTKIVYAIGHGFQTLDVAFKELIDSLFEIEPLDYLAWYDICFHFTNISGLINEELHDLEKYTGADYAEKHLSFLHRIYEYFDLPVQITLGQYRSKLESQANKSELIHFLQTISERVIEESGEGEKATRQDFSPNYSWELLWLDDQLSTSEDLAISTELTARGIKVHTCKNYDEARSIWGRDLARSNSIKIVVADYRLLEADGRLCSKQGYHFLKYLSVQKSKPALVAYSGLPRKFLIESFKHYGISINIFSKKDFPISNESSVKYLCNEFVLLGDQHWEISNNQPLGSHWKNWESYYFEYANSLNFHRLEPDISRSTTANLEQFIKLHKLNPSEARLPGQYKSPSSSCSGKLLEQMLRARRIILGLYYYLESNSNLESNGKYINQLVYQSPDAKKDAILSSNQQGQLFVNCAIKLESLPLGLFPEERAWLKYDSGLKIDLDFAVKEHWNWIKKIKIAFSKSFENKALLAGYVDAKGHIIINKDDFPDDRRIYSFREDGILQIYVSSNNGEPCLRTADEVKALLAFYYYKLDIDSDRYLEHLSDFVHLCREVCKIVRGKLSFVDHLKTLESFVNRFKSKSPNIKWLHREDINRERTVFEEYAVLHAPWEFDFFYEERLSDSFDAASDIYREKCLRSCTDEAFAKQTDPIKEPFFDIYRFVSKVENISDTERNYIIYREIFEAKKRRREHFELIFRKQGGNSQENYGSGAETTSLDQYDERDPQAGVPFAVWQLFIAHVKDTGLKLSDLSVRYSPYVPGLDRFLASHPHLSGSQHFVLTESLGADIQPKRSNVVYTGEGRSIWCYN